MLMVLGGLAGAVLPALPGVPLVFGGLDLLDRIKRGLAAAVRSRGLRSFSASAGSRSRCSAC